jgi:hypothetical protein
MKNILLSLCMLTAMNSTFPIHNEAINNTIDKALLRKAVKADMYDLAFIRELFSDKILEAIMKETDFSDMAQGNATLKKDIKKLYKDLYTSHISREDAQRKLDSFCKKWNLKRIVITDLSQQ